MKRPQRPTGRAGFRRRRWLPVLALCCSAGAGAEGLEVNGANTLRLERYGVRGDPFASPYPFAGRTGYDELYLNFRWATGPDDHWTGFVSGVLNDSDYRSPFRGLVPERLVLTRENGSAAIPYRAEAGDFFGFTTMRTQLRPLKGALLELQPGASAQGLRSSWQVFTGAFSQGWRRLHWSDDNTTALSWLGEHEDRRLLVSLLRNERRALFLPGTPGLRQQVASLAADAPFALGPMRLRTEGEVAFLRGDHDGAGTGVPGLDKRDGSAFLQLTGSFPDSTFQWQLRGERHGQDYQPIGAAIAPDRRSLEGYLSWTSPTSLYLRGRLQAYRDAAETTNPLDTRVAGLALSGPLAMLGASVNADLFSQDLERRDGTLAQKTFTANGSFSRPFGNWLGTLNLLHQRIDDRTSLDADQTTRQVGLSATGALQLGPWQGSITPGLLWRQVRGGFFPTRDWHGTLAFALAGGAHRLSVSAGRLAQDRPADARALFADVATVDFGIDYRWRRGAHEFGVDATWFDRKPRPGQRTEAYRIGATWVYHFQPATMRAAGPAGPALAATERLATNASLLVGVTPGAPLDATLTRLADAGLGAGLRQPNAVVFEQRLLPDIDQRQRVVVVHDSGTVERVALLVSLADAGSPEQAGRIYDRVLRALIDRFGRPVSTFEEGQFGPGYASDLAAGRLIRVAEWTTANGVLRLGLPRRLDGVARIEVQHARRFGGMREAGWGVEGVR